MSARLVKPSEDYSSPREPGCGSRSVQLSLMWAGLPPSRKSSRGGAKKGLLGLGKLGLITGVKTMTVYLIADVKVTDDKWVPSYAASVHDIVHKHGGKYLSRSGNVKTLEGKPLDTTLIALLQFPSAEAAEAFVNDPEYAPHAAARQAGSEGHFQLID